MRDSDGLRILSAGRIGESDHDDEKRPGKSNTAGADDGEGATAASKKSNASAKMSASRLKRHQARKAQERDTTSAREKIEAAAATLAENQKNEKSAVLISFMACDKRYRHKRLTMFSLARRL